jgi:hypothetical protein
VQPEKRSRMSAMAYPEEHRDLFLALQHTLTFAEGVVEQVRRVRMAIEGELKATPEDLATLKVQETKWRAHIEEQRMRVASFAIEPPHTSH